jgi:hypothetical protein
MCWRQDSVQRGHLRGASGSLMGECASPGPSLRAHPLFMARRRPCFLPRQKLTGSEHSCPGRGRRALRQPGKQQSGSMRCSWAEASPLGAGRGSRARPASPTSSHSRHCRGTQPAGRCVHLINYLHPPGNGPQRCQSH